ncbi:hypothetical protein CEUSTIGMA_g1527.t1 [Chlamydomonas eustigma]|uniref:Uncharacterized protein n=1 Tax=Chlamydomonas eustigma TaxID=1157962 RepID=A0A250WTC9_9CHLO|nr:hypothetical protein CEUSTIGMA_g1527.t1 [Chlamydomonas eustigma]|eukprot:GAX74077.1 hypothetical protein CEUSTIGMA_g1527.t1 [Chlamydomonas eustigma]
MIPAAPAINGDAIPDRVGSPSPPRPSRPTRSELEAMFHHIMRELKYTHGNLSQLPPESRVHVPVVHDNETPVPSVDHDEPFIISSPPENHRVQTPHLGRLPSPSKLTHSFFKSVSDGTHGADIAARFREILRWLRKNRYSVEEELPTFIDDHSVHKFVSEFLENLLRTNQPLIDDELIDAVTRFVSGEGFQSVGRSGKVAAIKPDSQKRSRPAADEAGPSGLRSCPHHANNQAKKPQGPPEDCPLYGKEGRVSEAEKSLLSEWAIFWYCRKGTHMAKDCPLKKKKDEPK